MSNILVFIIAVIVVCVIAKIFSAPIKLIIKILVNALIGGIVLIILNWIGGNFGLHIDLNFLTALITGVLGVPGVIICLILQMFI